MSKHTPGPWKYVQDTYYRGEPTLPTDIAGSNGAPVTDFDGRQDGVWMSPEDARLVAAAPELLAALKDLLAPHNMPEEYQARIDRARAVISKAEGK